MVHYSRAEKMVLFSTFTVSTMPMMVASTGSFSVSGVRRALDPCTINTISPCPAPTVSTTTKVRPVLTSRSRWPGSTRSGSTVRSLRPVMEATFCVATTLPVTRARNMGASLAGIEQGLCLPGDDQFFIRRHDPELHAAFGQVYGRFALRSYICLRVQGNTEPAEVGANGVAHRHGVLADT